MTPPPLSPDPQQLTAATSPPSVRRSGRDRIVVVGRRRAGKTVFLARLYETLWRGCALVDGVVVGEGAPTAGRRVVEMSCRATSGAAHRHFMAIIEELQAGRWPAATLGNSYAELIVSYGGRERVLTALDYPGEVFRKAFLEDSSDADARELLAAIDSAAAVIFLIDPSVVVAGNAESHEDSFGLTQAAARIRGAADGKDVPIAVVLTKADINKGLLREAGGVREFARTHFGQMFRSLERTSVFASAAVRSAPNPLGATIPHADRPAENVVEPLRYCLELIDVVADQSRIVEARRLHREANIAVERHEQSQRQVVTKSWTIFAIAMVLLFAVVGVVTWFVVSQRA